jgi:hypothetical protein
MTTYQIYTLDEQDRLLTAREVACDPDQAVTIARANLAPGRRGEIWQGPDRQGVVWFDAAPPGSPGSRPPTKIPARRHIALPSTPGGIRT